MKRATGLRPLLATASRGDAAELQYLLQPGHFGLPCVSFLVLDLFLLAEVAWCEK